MSISILQKRIIYGTFHRYKQVAAVELLISVRSILRILRLCHSDSGKTMDSIAANKTEGLLIQDVVKKLELWAPLSLAGSWDRVGLQVEPSGRSNKVSRLMVTNDLTEAVVEEAVNSDGIGMILSYHPPIFRPLKSLTNSNWKERVITACIEKRIAIYSPHTAWDAVQGGINDWLASAFDTSSVKPLSVAKTWSIPGLSNKYITHLLEVHILDANLLNNDTIQELTKYAESFGSSVNTRHSEKGRIVVCIGCNEKSLTSLVEYVKSISPESSTIQLAISKYEQMPLPGHGEGRFCELKAPLPLQEVVNIVKAHLKLKHVRLAVACQSGLDSPVNSIALCAGSGSSVLSGVRADVLLTGEMGHHDVLEANHQGSHVILCEHTNTERGFLRSLVDGGFLHKLFEGNVQVIMSSKDKEPLQVV